MYFYRITNPLHTDMHCASADSDIPHFTARGAAGVALLYPCDIESGTDWLNLALKPWKHPGNGEKRRDSAVTLFRLAVARSIRVLSAAEAVLKGDRSSESLAEEIGDSCLSISGDDGHIAPVRVSEPFDLIRTLKVEVERRRVWLETPIC